MDDRVFARTSMKSIRMIRLPSQASHIFIAEFQCPFAEQSIVLALDFLPLKSGGITSGGRVFPPARRSDGNDRSKGSA
jgi:hypothetical protein